MKSAVACLMVGLASICAGLSEDGQLSIAAFNVQIFGVSKFSKPDVVSILSRIVRRYDVVLIQEIRDVSQTVIPSFLDVVNNDSLADGVQYSLSVSERLGRTNSKEQYAFMYRRDKVTVLAVHQYNDTADLFERPPYSVLLTTPGLPQFFLTGVHIQPSSVFDEVNSLLPVYEVVASAFNTPRGLILGDLNADCSTLSQSRYSMLDLVNDGRFHWLIDSQADTTTNSNDCAYDRIVVTEGVLDYVVNGSAGVFRYDDEYGLSMTVALAVSDHYPVHLTLQGTGTGTGGGMRLAALLPLVALCTLISAAWSALA